MKRQGLIYIILTLACAGISVYLTNVCSVLYWRFGLSSTTLIYLSALALVIVLTVFYGLIAFLFAKRAVATLQRANGGYLLIPSDSQDSRIFAPATKLWYRFGDQTANEGAKPSFALFGANGKFWVTDLEAYNNAVNQPATIDV